MKLIETKDGTFTVYNENYNEHYHSISGALEEAFEKHVKPLNINDGMHILDFCFGLGYNSIAALHGHKNIKIIALENDIRILQKMKQLRVPENIRIDYEFFSDLYLMNPKTDARNNRIEMMLGDARNTLKVLKDKFFDRVFFDPFSPGKQPELWSENVFRELYRIMKPGAQLSTYSCAGWIRNNMKSAGLIVNDGPAIGRRSPGTIARRSV